MEAFEFPSAVESEVASALLLLSTITTTPPSLTLSPPPEKSYTSKTEKMKKNTLRFKISKSQQSQWTCSSSSSSSSTVTTSGNDDQRVKVIGVVSKFHETMKLKVVRKRRSKSFSISDSKKFSSTGKQAVKVEPSASVSEASASSCLSSGSSGRGNVMINRRGGGRGSNLFVTPAAKEDLKRKPVLGSAHMRRRAEAIMKVLLSHGRASEVEIRGLLGDSPSTSKALRILLNLEQVKRSGAGGRADPYIYMIA